MSLSNQTNKTYGSGNGVTVTFSFSFKIFDASELYVYLITTATGAVTGPLTLNSDYTVSISSVTEGGTVTFAVAPSASQTWFIKRLVPYTQSAIIPSEGNLPGKQIENQLDLITMMVVQDQEAISRAVTFPATYTGSVPTLPIPQAGLALAWDPTGTFLVNIAATGVGTIAVPIANGNLATLTAANLVNGTSLFNLAGIVAGAGIIPVANLPVGTTANKILQLNASAKIPAVDGSLLTNVIATTNANTNGNQLGAWRTTDQVGNATFVAGTIYQALTDGFFCAKGSGNPTSSLTVYTGSASNLSGALVFPAQSAGSGNQSVCITVPIRKNDYYRVTLVVGSMDQALFLPMGS